jgi:hypothetical protein
MCGDQPAGYAGISGTFLAQQVDTAGRKEYRYVV